MELITAYSYAMYTNTELLARLKGGFLLNDIFERFTQKINSTLKPEEQRFWFYIAHDYTVANILNGLGVFEVSSFLLEELTQRFLIFFFLILKNSYTFHHTRAAYTLSYIKTAKIAIICSFSIENHTKNVQHQLTYLDAEQSVLLTDFTNFSKALWPKILILNAGFN